MEVFEDFTMSVLQLNKLVQKIKTFEIEKFGLKPVHVMCGYYLLKYPQGLTAKELCDLSLDDKAAISRALKTMLEKGYVHYDTNVRNAKVRLTDGGKELARHISDRSNIAVAAGSIDFTESERAFFYKSLNTIVINLKSYYKELVKNND